MLGLGGELNAPVGKCGRFSQVVLHDFHGISVLKASSSLTGDSLREGLQAAEFSASQIREVQIRIFSATAVT